jgi:non-specific serine/threonine protein kinase
MGLSPGARLGVYEIISLLGAGGMGEVYRARDPRLGRDVAIKVVPAAFSADPDRLRRFEQEARAAAALNHPNILAVYDVGTHDRQPYVVSELLDGETLNCRLARGAFSLDELFEVSVQIANALDAAHTRGIVHRDLKPANLFVTTRGQVKVLDFGLAKMRAGALTGAIGLTAAQTEAHAGPRTDPGTALGTIAYMSPEQARGEPVDARSDLFSFGVVLYEMATGQSAFTGATSAVIFDAILNRVPTSVVQVNPALPLELARIIDRALEKRPEARYQHAHDLVTGLRAVQRAHDIATSHSGNRRAAVRPSIAVLPFSDMSPQHDQDYFCEGIAEELINALTAVEGLRVAARTSSFQFKGKAVDVSEIGARLKVDTILEGSIRKAGNRLRITAQLINTGDGYHLWSERYDRELDDVFVVQDEIARAIVSKLQVTLRGDPGRALVAPPTDDLEAYSLYLQGRYYWARRAEGFLQRAISCFEQAIARDASYALAHAGLADAYSTLGLYGGLPPDVAWSKAKPAAQNAIRLNNESGEAHHAMALVHWLFDWDFVAAERAFQKAIALNPSSGLSHAAFGNLLGSLGHFEQGISEATHGRALEPMSALIGVWVAFNFINARRFDMALDECRRALDLDPSFGLAWFTQSGVLSALEKHDEAIDAAERAITLLHHQSFFFRFGRPRLCSGRSAREG